mmetsp:Transcript_18645/g.43590  ORF Transcript_18645/g.43590 Transcript_18645/m.43590 type:complete len:378 (-) Transcript_18645:73-1206(-)
MTEGFSDLGFSSESEGPETGDIVAQRSETSEADFKEYARSLGVDAVDGDLLWVAREAFEAPLPASWSEHMDEESRVYFFNQVTQQSSWSHPMDEVFRELVHLIKSVRRLDPPEASVAEAVQAHLQSCHDRASAALEGWSGPYAAEDGEYFYHAGQGVSTWHNPVEEWQAELSVRQQVLHRCLLGSASKVSNGISRSPGAVRDAATPALPLHLARPSAEGAAPPSPSSARSYATCISARSTSVTPRSRRPSLSPSEVPSRNNSKPRAGASLPAERDSANSDKLNDRGDHPEDSQSTKAVPRQRALQPPAGVVDEELDITFGHTGGLTLPQFGQSDVRKVGEASAASDAPAGEAVEAADKGEAPDASQAKEEGQSGEQG